VKFWRKVVTRSCPVARIHIQCLIVDVEIGD
jgi:hypothetical protein